MKTMFHFLVGVVIMFSISTKLAAQCGPGLGPFTVRYDTTVYGSGSAPYSFSLPQFHIPLGVLLSANVQAVVNLKFSYTVENLTNTAQIYKAKSTRSDELYSASIDPNDILTANIMSNVNHTLLPHQKISYGPIYRTYKTVSDSITTSDPSLFNFLGNGTVDFNYETSSAMPFNSGVIDPIPVVVDTIRFSVTYLYCLTSLLPADKLFFTATAPSKGNVLLNWRQQNVEANRVYYAQVSTDGRNFTNIATVNENTSGAYVNTYLHNSTTKLYFRILQQNVTGEVKYSEIRTIDPGSESTAGVRVFPTVYNGGNLQFNFPARGAWRIDVYSADGKKVIESRQTDASSVQLVLPAAVSNGVYTAEVINTQNQQKYITRIIVQR